MDKLKTWFLINQRALPWREDKTPYRVWISEVMLQQTQVAVVVGYFERWMKRFPTVLDLAKASQEEVMKAWEGLGYYSRARNLLTAARQIVSDFAGEIPSKASLLEKLPGFGPYTIGAITSFAFGQRAAAVDGNVVRVLSRYLGSFETRRKFYEGRTLELLPEKEPWVVMEGLIELGALICLKKPQCPVCPLKSKCKAHLQGITDQLPVKKEAAPTIFLKRQVAIVRYGDEVLVCKREKEVMAGLYEFPYADIEAPLPFTLPLKKVVDLPIVKHSFTRYQATLYPTLYEASKKKKLKNFQWKKVETLKTLPFSSGHRKICEHLTH